MVSEYERIIASLANYNLQEKEELAKLIWEEINGKSLEDIIWKEEGGKADPLGFYYDGKWHRIDDYKGNEIEGIEVIRKAKDVLTIKTEEELAPEYWRIRKIKFVRKDGRMVPVGDWREYPTEITKKVWDLVGEVYRNLFDISPFFDITLFGSCANGSMKNGSDLEYTIIIDPEKLRKSELYIGGCGEDCAPYSVKEWGVILLMKFGLKMAFESIIVDEAKKRGIDLKIGYSYFVCKEKNGKIYDPDGVSKEYPIRLLFSGDERKFVDYSKMIK